MGISSEEFQETWKAAEIGDTFCGMCFKKDPIQVRVNDGEIIQSECCQVPITIKLSEDGPNQGGWVVVP